MGVPAKEFMMTPREKLIERLKILGGPSASQGNRPLVTLEEIFEGNDDLGSIGYNLNEHPGIRFFYDTLRSIRSKANVQDVLVEVADFVPEDESMWPFSDRIYVLANASRTEVAQWTAVLQPDEIEAGFPVDNIPHPIPDLWPGAQVWAAWWD
jgi:hypothetical protein